MSPTKWLKRSKLLEYSQFIFWVHTVPKWLYEVKSMWLKIQKIWINLFLWEKCILATIDHPILQQLQIVLPRSPLGPGKWLLKGTNGITRIRRIHWKHCIHTTVSEWLQFCAWQAENVKTRPNKIFRSPLDGTSQDVSCGSKSNFSSKEITQTKHSYLR